MELMFVQAIILTFLVTWLLVEEEIYRPHHEAEWDYFHDIFGLPMSPEEVEDFHRKVWHNRIRYGLNVATRLREYGALGWGGL